MLGRVAHVERRQVLEALEQKSCTGEDDHGEPDLRRDERLPHLPQLPSLGAERMSERSGDERSNRTAAIAGTMPNSSIAAAVTRATVMIGVPASAMVSSRGNPLGAIR